MYYSQQTKATSGLNITLSHDGAPRWLHAIIRCLNPNRPDYGFGESGSYLSWALAHHPEAHLVMARKDCARNLSVTAAQAMNASSGGFCCPLIREASPTMSAADTDIEFMGVELGHKNLGVGFKSKLPCRSFRPSLTSTTAYSEDGLLDKAQRMFPPPNHEFWKSRPAGRCLKNRNSVDTQ